MRPVLIRPLLLSILCFHAACSGSDGPSPEGTRITLAVVVAEIDEAAWREVTDMVSDRTDSLRTALISDVVVELRSPEDVVEDAEALIIVDPSYLAVADDTRPLVGAGASLSERFSAGVRDRPEYLGLGIPRVSRVLAVDVPIECASVSAFVTEAGLPAVEGLGDEVAGAFSATWASAFGPADLVSRWNGDATFDCLLVDPRNEQLLADISGGYSEVPFKLILLTDDPQQPPAAFGCDSCFILSTETAQSIEAQDFGPLFEEIWSHPPTVEQRLLYDALALTLLGFEAVGTWDAQILLPRMQRFATYDEPGSEVRIGPDEIVAGLQAAAAGSNLNYEGASSQLEALGSSMGVTQPSVLWFAVAPGGLRTPLGDDIAEP